MPEYVPFTRQFPLELIGCITEAFQGDLLGVRSHRGKNYSLGTQNLINLSLVHRNWTEVAQQTLISVIIVHSARKPSFDAMSRMLKEYSHRIRYVKVLQYTGEGWARTSYEVDEMLKMLTEGEAKLAEVELSRDWLPSMNYCRFSRLLS